MDEKTKQGYEQAYSPENVDRVLSAVDSGELDMASLPGHVQYELERRRVPKQNPVVRSAPSAALVPESGPETQRNYASMAAVITSGEADVETIMDSYRNAVSEHAKSLAQMAASRSYQADKQALVAVGAEQARTATTEEELREAAEVTAALQAEVDDKAASPLSIEVKYADVLAAQEAGELDVANAAVDVKIYNDITEILESRGILGTIYDYGKMLLIPGKEAEDLAGLVGASDVFVGREKLLQAVVAFDSITNPAEKFMVWEQLKAQLLDELSPTQAAAVLSTFASGELSGALEEYTPLSVAISGADGLLVGAGVLASVARRASNSAKVASNLGNIRAAAKMVAKSVQAESDDAALAAGAGTKADAVSLADPIKIRGLSDDDVNLLSPAVQRELQANAAALNRQRAEIIESTITAPLQGEQHKVYKSLVNQVMAKLRRTDVDVVGAEVIPVSETSVRLRMKVLPKSQKADNAEDLAEAVNFRDSVKEPKRTNQERRIVDEVSFEVGRITARRLPEDKAQKQLHRLLKSARVRRPLANVILNRMRANPDLWKSVVGDMSRGRWERAARRMENIDRGIGRAWPKIKNHPVLVEEVANLLRDNWKQNRGKGPRKPRVRVIEHEISAQIDDYTGTLNQTELPFAAPLLSNRAVARSAETVEQFDKAAMLDNLSARVYDILHKNLERIFKDLEKGGDGKNPLSRKFKGWTARRRIDKALIDGDEYVDPDLGGETGKVWTPAELRFRFELNDAEIAAYYKARQLFDHLYILLDQAARKELVALGYKEYRAKRIIKYTNEAGEEVTWRLLEIGRPMDTYQEAYQYLERAGVPELYDSVADATVKYSREALNEAYNSGRRVVRLHTPFRHPVTGKRVQHILAGADEIRELPQQVLTYKEGYVPRVYTRGVWFVRAASRNATVDGRLSDVPVRTKTMGMTDNKAAAERLARLLADEGDGSVEFVVDAADKMDPADILSASPHGGGRLYTGARGDAPIPFYELDADGTTLIESKAERANAFDALQGNISNLSFHMPRNEWRMAMIKRLENTAAQLRVQWNGLHVPVGEGAGGPAAARFMERQRIQARDWLAIPDDWQTKWDETIQYLYEAALGKKLFRPAAPALWWIKSRDPVTALRAATFHLMLGLLNPVQTFVQAQGAAVAASMNIAGPAEIVRVWRLQSAMKALDLIDDMDTLRGAAKLLVKAGVTEAEADELIALTDAFRRSGLREGVTTNADFSAMEAGFGQVARSLSETLADKGLWFYRQGELFNRRFSFTTAFREFLEANPDMRGKMLDKRQLEAVTARANSLMLNLGRANRAAWQKGVLSIPTQFWQVQAKLIENYLQAAFGSEAAQFSRKEIMKMFAGQIALYGAAGLPIFGAVGSYYLDYNESGVASDPDSVMNRTFDEGLYGMIFATLGADVEVSKRGAILADLQDLWYDVALGDKSMAQAFMGAASSTVGRITDAFSRMEPLYIAALDPDAPMDERDFLIAMDTVGDLATSWSNLTKAYIMATQGKSMSRSGRLLDEGKYNLQTLVMTAMGFTPRADAQAYDLQMLDRMYTQTKADAKRSVKKMMQDYINASEVSGRDAGEAADRLRAGASYLLSFLREDDRVAMMEEIAQELRSGKSEFAKATNRFIRINNEAYLDAALSWYEKSVVGQSGIKEEAIE